MAKIIEFRAEGFRRIKAVTIRPDGNLVVISGANGAGKTSVLHGIWTLLKGRSVAGPMPINANSEKCVLQARTEEFTATRTFKNTPEGELTTDLKLVMADGRKITSKPQAVLDALLPDLGLDPMDFGRRPLKDQIDTLKGLVKGFDFTANAQARKRAFDLRTDENRRARDNAAAAESVVLPDGPEPQAMDATALVDQMAKAAEHNATLEKRRERRDRAASDLVARKANVEQLRRQLADVETEVADLEERLAGAPALPQPIDVAALQAKVAAADRVAVTRREFEKRRTLQTSAEAAQHCADALTQEIADLDAAKALAITSAALPVPGLSFDDDGITLNGFPFQQAQTSDKIRVGVAISMALCPPPSDPALRIITIDEGSELDSKSMALLAALADEHGYQIWLARVDESAQQGFVIVDGALQEG